MEDNKTSIPTAKLLEADPISSFQSHPSRSLASRKKGFGIGGGYEKPRKQGRTVTLIRSPQVYGPIPHQGYYGTTSEDIRFKEGDAGYDEEAPWFNEQYCKITSGFSWDD
jgi:hypothetical protein